MEKLCDNVNFIAPQLLPKWFETFGWNLKKFDTYNGLAVARADFYPIGFIIGFSNKAIIICDGETKINYNGEEYFDFEELKNKLGEKAYSTFPEWRIEIEKQWTIKKTNGEWVAAFSDLSEMPFRKDIRC